MPAPGNLVPLAVSAMDPYSGRSFAHGAANYTAVTGTASTTATVTVRSVPGVYYGFHVIATATGTAPATVYVLDGTNTLDGTSTLTAFNTVNPAPGALGTIFNTNLLLVVGCPASTPIVNVYWD